jgi:hypothetical protein
MDRGRGGRDSGVGSPFFLSYPLHTVLLITTAKEGNVVLCAEMAEGEEFVLSFVHSVNRRPVYDTLRLERDHLVVVKSRFDSFGAGMPEMTTDGGSLKIDRRGWLEWTVNRPVPDVTIFVGRVANHSVRLKGREVALAGLVEPGTALRMGPARISLLSRWRGRCMR